MGYNRAKKKMRKTIFLCLAMAVAMIIMPSCKKDKDASEQIQGKWTLTEGAMFGDIISDFVGETWEFKNNGKFTGALDGEEGKGVEYTDCNYTLDGNNLTLSGGDFNDDDWAIIRAELVINEISSKVLEVSGNLIGEGEDDGTTFKIPVSYKLKK